MKLNHQDARILDVLFRLSRRIHDRGARLRRWASADSSAVRSVLRQNLERSIAVYAVRVEMSIER